MENTHNFYTPSYILMGSGCLKDLTKLLLPFKLTKMLIVTDKNMIKLGYVEEIEKIFKSLYISYDVFDGILNTNAKISYVEEGVSYFNKGLNIFNRKYDMVVSLGGGTCHDTAKGIAILVQNGGNIIDYEGYNKLKNYTLPHIAINTTSGTGGQLSMYAIITDTSRGVKMVLGDVKMTPYISVSDPLLTYTMPKEITASSGIDALAHAIEAYFSIEAFSVTDALALGALNLIYKNLEKAYENGNDMKARENMVFADHMASCAFNSAGLGYVHAMSHQIGGLYDSFHGVANGILLPYVLEFNSASIPEEKIRPFAETLGIKYTSKLKALDKIIIAIEDLKKGINIPSNLKQIGVKREDIKGLAKNALKDICVMTNPRKGSLEDIENLYYQAL